MNGTTRCPYCDTRFRISKAQFTAHQGMVRCGRCMQAFDSRPSFVTEPVKVDLDKDSAVSGALSGAGSLEYSEPAASEVLAELAERVAFLEQTEPPAEPVAEPAEPDMQGLDFLHDADIELLEPALLKEARVAEHTVSIPAHSESDISLDFSLSPLSHILPAEHGYEDSQNAATAADDLSAGAAPVWARLIWPAGVFLAVLLLLAQAAYFFRAGIALHLPVLKPALVTCCSWLNCSIALPKNTELLSIESSALEADAEHENLTTFRVLLRNRANYAIAFPALVLTLNNSQDKALARRFILPEEYLPPEESIITGFLLNHEVNVQLRLNTQDLRPAGYRVELQYLPDPKRASN